MKLIPPDEPAKPSLAQLLCRGDIWQGQEKVRMIQPGLDTGFDELNGVLVGRGWPVGQLVEVCLPSAMQGEWMLLNHAIREMKGLVVLLNPPAIPFAQRLIQMGINLDRLILVKAQERADFLFSFVELTRSAECSVVMAWQPQKGLSYTDLRKCLLATQEAQGLYVLFRPLAVRDQSSPASLRLTMQTRAQDLMINIFKQKGSLKPQTEPVFLPLPTIWNGLPAHSQLDQNEKPQPKRASVTHLRIVKPGRT